MGTSNAKHKSLAGSFGRGPTPDRGSKLQGMLNAPAAAAPMQTPPRLPEDHDAEAGGQAVDAAVDSPHASEFAPAGGGAAVDTQVRRKRAAAGNRNASAASVYLTAEAYKALTTTKSRKMKDYAQIVQDAFAQIAKEAKETQRSPDEVLKSLFETPESSDPWLMPSSTTRAKSATPLTEARISFSDEQRRWLDDKMANVNVATFSEFIARVLEYHLLPAKRGKAAAGS